VSQNSTGSWMTSRDNELIHILILIFLIGASSNFHLRSLNLCCSDPMLLWTCAVLILICSETWGAEASSSTGGRGEEARAWATLQWQYRWFLVTEESVVTSSSGGPRWRGKPARNREGKRLLSVMQASSVVSETLFILRLRRSRKSMEIDLWKSFARRHGPHMPKKEFKSGWCPGDSEPTWHAGSHRIHAHV
jgi:hypothetical protein